MIDNFYKDQPREILKRKMGADQLLKKIEKGFQKFIHSPFMEKNNYDLTDVTELFQGQHTSVKPN